MLQKLTRQEYVSNIVDLESLHLLTVSDGKVYLRSDIELTGDGELRIEMMDFMLDQSLTLSEANSVCRGHYAGGIYFIEYGSIREAKENIMADFLEIEPDGIYLFCNDDELKQITEKYTNKNVYARINK